MKSGIVLVVRDSLGGADTTFPARARVLVAAATARGAKLVAWGAREAGFVFDSNDLDAALELIANEGPDRSPGWRAGVAQGDLEPMLADTSTFEVSWGTVLADATRLARLARPGEVLVSSSLDSVVANDLVVRGFRVAREGDVRTRGAIVDPAFAWRTIVDEGLSHMRKPALVGVDTSHLRLVSRSLLVVRADPGVGGTRFLAELEGEGRRALFLSPSGSGFEPLGALRGAFTPSKSNEFCTRAPELEEFMRRLLTGEGLSLEIAAQLVTTFLAPPSEKPNAVGLVLIDDAKFVDPASLEVCARAARAPRTSIAVVARLDATGGLPSVLAGVAKAQEIDLLPLPREAAAKIVVDVTGPGLDAAAQQRFARLGGNVPLGIVEAVAAGIARADIACTAEGASLRTRTAGRGKARTASEWVARRAEREPRQRKMLLCVLAMLGGRALPERTARIAKLVGAAFDVGKSIDELVAIGWLRRKNDEVHLPSRTHRQALLRLLDDASKVELHRAIVEVIEVDEGPFGRVEGAWHAAQSGDKERSARILLETARATADAGFQASTTQLIALARRTDPGCEEVALELLSNALDHGPSMPPSDPSIPSTPPSERNAAERAAAEAFALASRELSPGEGEPEAEVETTDTEPPTLMDAVVNVEIPPSFVGAARLTAPIAHAPASEIVLPQTPTPQAPVSNSADIASRLGERAKAALLGSDNAALEQWVDGLRAAGESSVYTDRLRALTRLGRGDVGDALRLLRRTRETLAPTQVALRCQTSLALAVALSMAGRPDEALLEGMDALARARQIQDEQGTRASLALVAKLLGSAGRREADQLRAAIAVRS